MKTTLTIIATGPKASGKTNALAEIETLLLKAGWVVIEKIEEKGEKITAERKTL
jgi:hypothetical protein